MGDAPKIVDAGNTPDFFVDEALDFDILNGTLRIRLGVAKPNAATLPAPQQLVHSGRLIMPIAGAQRLSVALYNALKNAGFDPGDALAGSDRKPN